MSTLLITHPACLNHLTPLGHPERPERLRAVEHALEAEKFQSLARVQAPTAPFEIIDVYKRQRQNLRSAVRIRC